AWRDPERRDEDLGAAAMPHPGHPSLRAREHGEEKQKIWVQVVAITGDRLGGRDHAPHVAVVRDAVKPDGQGSDVLLDAPARGLVHGRRCYCALGRTGGATGTDPAARAEGAGPPARRRGDAGGAPGAVAEPRRAAA